jgi:1,4-dihydroxy-2-naphthoate polyprenyltransferase
VTRTAHLFIRMLRWRVAITLWAFLLLGAAGQGPIRPTVSLFLTAVALCASYVVATTVNDVADQDIDRINHPLDAGRPLVTGDASERDLWRTNAVAAPVAIIAASLTGAPTLGLTVASLAIGYSYSLRPLRLAYRTWAAPAVLAVAYVLVPYGLGMLAAGGRIDTTDGLLAAALYMLFVARINLKDFRDREGDAAFGKPTLLLAHGKTATCAVSLVGVLFGCALLVFALGPHPGLGVVVALFAAAILWMLRVLWHSDDARSEQIAIGIGAKMGNGLLACAFAWLLLGSTDAPDGMRALTLAFLAVVFGSVFRAMTSGRADIRIAYKG